MKFTLGFSPCPNDTFIFDALVNKKIDPGEMTFETVIEDVETLNQFALQEKLDITKLSFPAFFQSLDKYILLNSGSALGKGVGPILISRSQIQNSKLKIDDLNIAIPGINTTANMLLSFAFPNAIKKTPMIFSEIEDAVLTGKTDLGVIIHENRFTFQQKGLHKILDLGEYWEEKIKLPIPLGGIAINRKFDALTGKKIDSLIKKSLEYSFSNYPLITDYVKHYSQTMSENVMRQHIDLYVNNFSLELGAEGKSAIKKMYNVFLSLQTKQIESPSNSLFIK